MVSCLRLIKTSVLTRFTAVNEWYIRFTPSDREDIKNVQRIGSRIVLLNEDLSDRRLDFKLLTAEVFTNKCSGKNCHVKEIVPVMCSECKLNFCLKHRHPADHQCEGAAGTARMRALEAAVARQANLHAVDASLSSHSPKPIKSEPTEPETSAAGIQGGLSEDEALARALALSLQDSCNSQPNGTIDDRQQQVDEDHMLARAIAESERQLHTATTVSLRDRCNIS
ncbi:hypothetical protein B7P43_G10340 [Cryptotermes secundus]|uniref:AN1-type domain-containing protein n=1 Tax=Cryptotermes secundus TaxID=105785 RepID=A0A2J7PZE9_9NEOP|nr:hypothetical protein B7P43_G10340 [Cryptotermes secundus]